MEDEERKNLRKGGEEEGASTAQRQREKGGEVSANAEGVSFHLGLKKVCFWSTIL